MSLNTLETAYANGQVIDASHINELTLSNLGTLVGRDANGVPTSGENIGTLALPFGNVYANGIILNGQALDTTQIVSQPNRIVSGQTRTLSAMADFLRPNGSALEFTIKGATTNLILSINNIAVNVTSDLTQSGFAAAPSANNTALRNDTVFYAQYSTKYAGEDGYGITIDSAGSEITAKVGQVVAFKLVNEIFIGTLKSATEIVNCYRGWFFDSAGSPIIRETLSDNDTITLMSLGWVFVEDNGTTVDVSYTTPVTSYVAPSSPTTGDYWFDVTNQVWKRYSGTSWEIINRTLIGQVVADDTACIGARSMDFSNAFSDFNNIEVQVQSTEIIESVKTEGSVSVYGQSIHLANNQIDWNITTDLEGALTEQATTLYYLYISENGQRIISDEKPHWRADLKGDYHPYHSWRLLGITFNNSSNDFIGIYSEFFTGGAIAAVVNYNTTATTIQIIPDLNHTIIHRGRSDIQDKIALYGDSVGGNSSSAPPYSVTQVVYDNLLTGSSNEILASIVSLAASTGGAARAPIFMERNLDAWKFPVAVTMKVGAYRVDTGATDYWLESPRLAYNRVNKN